MKNLCKVQTSCQIVEFIQPPTTAQIIGKIIWDNLIQIIMFLVVVVLLVMRWKSLTSSVRAGVITIMLVYFLIRFGVAYQSLKFEREIEKDKQQGKNKDLLPEN